MVFHPQGTSIASTRANRAVKLGAAWLLLKTASKLFNKLSHQSNARQHAAAGSHFFSDAVSQYSKLDKSIIHRVPSVNSEESIDLLRKNEIDVICCLGGEIIEEEFIKGAGVACLNIHSGLSPFYNGSASSAWAVAEGRPNFAGVTLMHMNEKIDGGKVIAHHLPSIEEGDTAASLFMKGIIGAVDMLDSAISALESNDLFSGIPQERSFKYTVGMDWNIYQDLKLKRFEKSGGMKAYTRKAKTIFYEKKHLDMEFPYTYLLSHILKKN